MERASGTRPTLQANRVRGARRVFRDLADRGAVFVRVGAGSPGVGEVLQRVGAVPRVFVLGPRPGGNRAGFAAWSATGLPPGWSVHPRGHYLEGEHPVLRYATPAGELVELVRAAQWYGDAALDATEEEAADAWSAVTDELRRSFDERVVLLTSPAATGRELWLRTIPRGHEWTPLPDELGQMIRHTTGQGRVELIPHARVELPGLVGLDGRFMYAALCWGLPAGDAELQAVTDYLGHTRARYHATATVPRDWHRACRCGAPGHAGIGLLPRAADDAGDGWSYPSAPGERFVGWWDGAELAVALAHGWDVRPWEAVVWSGATGVSGPLDGWAKRLVSARERIAMRTARNGGSGRVGTMLSRRVGTMAAAAVRAILLHALGAFHGSTHRVTRSVPLGETDGPVEVPEDAAGLRVEGDELVWTEHQAPAWPELVHPEWSAAVWARARARLLSGPGGTGALHVPSLDVVAFRTDALYLTRDPEWTDDGKPGRLRVTRRIPGPVRTPRTHAELLELVRPA